jgi:hypothetical protein
MREKLPTIHTGAKESYPRLRNKKGIKKRRQLHPLTLVARGLAPQGRDPSARRPWTPRGGPSAPLSRTAPSRPPAHDRHSLDGPVKKFLGPEALPAMTGACGWPQSRRELWSIRVAMRWCRIHCAPNRSGQGPRTLPKAGRRCPRHYLADSPRTSPLARQGVQSMGMSKTTRGSVYGLVSIVEFGRWRATCGHCNTQVRQLLSSGAIEPTTEQRFSGPVVSQ